MPHLTTNSGIEWYFDTVGRGDPLLFIHGWGVDRRIWRQQQKHFSRNYNVISVDLPGHGLSKFKKVELTQIAEDINQILESLDIDKITVVGSSLGGLVALKIYDLFPEGFKRLVFVGSAPKFSRADDYPYGLDMEQMRKLGKQIKEDYPSILNIFFRSLFTKQERQTRRYKWLQRFRRDDKPPMQDALIECLDILEVEDLREVLREVDIPTQFINGREDTICRQESVNIIKEILPSARYCFFEECGHFPFLSKAYEFNGLLEEFMRETS
ncbi:MAG: alpha/beta hydrolase [Candidatus Zapsychrus exili]|nr:alpha/beta hydrolase [Candidatus Zapsychrus exili]